MQLALKYILIIFIICSREIVNVMQTHHVHEDAKEKETGHKQRRLLRMSVSVTALNRLKDLLNEQLMPQEFHLPELKGYGSI